MSDIKFNCPSCKQSLEAPPDMAGQLIECPACRQTVEIPIPRPTPKVETKSPLPRPAHAPRQPRPPPPTRNPESASAATTTVLTKILTMLVLITVMVGGFFGYNFWKDQQRAKVEEPFFVAAKEALDEAHKLQSALGVGLNYQKYGDELILLAAKVDNLLRAAVDTGIENLRPEAKVFCQHLLAARESFKSAREWWEIKIKYSDLDNTKAETELQDDWNAASKAIDQADRVYSTLKNH